MCSPGLILSSDQSACLMKDLACNYEPSDYVLNSEGALVCPECMDGYYPDAHGECITCDNKYGPYCTECSLHECTACLEELDFFPSADGQECVEYSGCEEDFELVFDEEEGEEILFCSLCSLGYQFSEFYGECAPCSITNPGCTNCEVGNTCSECQVGYFLSQD